MKKIIGLLVLVALAYVALPYWSAYSLAKAVDAADEAALEPKVEWDTLRNGLSDDVGKVLEDRVDAATGGNLLGKLVADAVAPNLVDSALEATINPKTISTIIRRARAIQAEMSNLPRDDVSSGGEGGEDESSMADIRYAFFDDLNTFRVSLAPADVDATTDLIFERRGLSWPLVRLNLPDNALSGLTD